MGLFKRKAEIKEELLILYGTKSGNSKLVAQQTQRYFQRKGLNVSCKNLSNFHPNKLSKIKKLLVVVSTHGEGEPPPTAKKFYSRCLGADMIKLNHLNYSICALGDSAYNKFCWAGKTLDSRFIELGAKQMSPRVDCDDDFSDDAVRWIQRTAEVIFNKTVLDTEAKKKEEEVIFNPINEYSATIIERTPLTSEKTKLATYHLSLDISHLNLKYHIGDVIDIMPPNPKWLMDAVATKLGLSSAELLKTKEITSISVHTIINYAQLTQNNAINTMLSSSDKLKDYSLQANVMDLLCDYPTSVSSTDILNIIPQIKGRKYSISSSQKRYPNQLHLTIKTVRYKYNDMIHEGAASVYTNEFLPLNGNIQFKLIQNNHFELPDDFGTPIIMIGVSTGIAPFRAILQEREALNLQGNTWILWGNKSNADDFLYQEDLNHFVKMGVLEKMNTAFSGDSGGKRHFQDELLAHSDSFVQWINKGAHVYVCGSRAMGKSVTLTIHKILASCNTSINVLINQGRWHEDVY